MAYWNKESTLGTLLESTGESLEVPPPDERQERACQRSDRATPQPPGEGEVFFPGESRPTVALVFEPEPTNSGNEPTMLNSHKAALLPLSDGHPVECSEWPYAGLTLERCPHPGHLC